MHDKAQLPVFRWDQTVPYEEASRHQEEFVADEREAIILCEHPPTITLGTSAQQDDLAFSRGYYERMGVSVHKSPRGGKATYHGPGQLVCYPIVNLRRRSMTIHTYLRFLEEIMVRLCETYGVIAHPIKGKTGVWVDNRKIGFIGVRVRRGYTFHGCSFNVTSQCEPFRLIVPCGMPQLETTSLEEETGSPHAVWEVADRMLNFFSELGAGSSELESS